MGVSGAQADPATRSGDGGVDPKRGQRRSLLFRLGKWLAALVIVNGSLDYNGGGNSYVPLLTVAGVAPAALTDAFFLIQ